MLDRTYPKEVCSAARTLEVVGERWSMLIVRDAMMAGASRFADFQCRLGVAPNVLSKRLRDLVQAGVFERDADGGYALTRKGLDLQPVLLALTQWGDVWAADSRGLPVAYRHAGCGGQVSVGASCSDCQAPPSPEDVRAEPADWALAAKRGV